MLDSSIKHPFQTGHERAAPSASLQDMPSHQRQDVEVQRGFPALRQSSGEVLFPIGTPPGSVARVIEAIAGSTGFESFGVGGQRWMSQKVIQHLLTEPPCTGLL